MKDIHDIVYQMSREDIEQFLFIISMSDICHFWDKEENRTLVFDSEVPVCQNGPFVQINLVND